MDKSPESTISGSEVETCRVGGLDDSAVKIYVLESTNLPVSMETLCMTTPPFLVETLGTTILPFSTVIQCRICEATFDLKSNLINHVIEAHGSTRKDFKCDIWYQY